LIASHTKKFPDSIGLVQQCFGPANHSNPISTVPAPNRKVGRRVFLSLADARDDLVNHARRFHLRVALSRALTFPRQADYDCR
jgi:hypothetical protein